MITKFLFLQFIAHKSFLAMKTAERSRFLLVPTNSNEFDDLKLQLQQSKPSDFDAAAAPSLSAAVKNGPPVVYQPGPPMGAAPAAAASPWQTLPPSGMKFASSMGPPPPPLPPQPQGVVQATQALTPSTNTVGTSTSAAPGTLPVVDPLAESPPPMCKWTKWTDCSIQHDGSISNCQQTRMVVVADEAVAADGKIIPPAFIEEMPLAISQQPMPVPSPQQQQAMAMAYRRGGIMPSGMPMGPPAPAPAAVPAKITNDKEDCVRDNEIFECGISPLHVAGKVQVTQNIFILFRTAHVLVEKVIAPCGRCSMAGQVVMSLVNKQKKKNRKTRQMH